MKKQNHPRRNAKAEPDANLADISTDKVMSVYPCAAAKKPLPPMTSDEAFEECRTMPMTDAIRKLRQLKVKKDNAAIHKLKQNSLKAFCALGMFTEEGHQKQFFIPETYTGVIPVDIDEPED